MFLLFQINLEMMVRRCLRWLEGGGAMAVWCQILDKMRDFATMTLPRRDRLRVESEVAFADTLGISCCQRESMFSGLMGRIIPRVERGSVEGEGVFGGGVYVEGERGITRDLVQLMEPPVAWLY